MKIDPENLSAAKFLAKYSDARRGGLSRKETEQILADQAAHEAATVGDPMEDDDVCGTCQ